MALETLKDVKEIGGFDLHHIADPWDITPEEFSARRVVIHDRTNTIAFNLQNGPIKEVGVNGCQVDTMIEAAKLIIEGFQKKFPCRENAVVITKLDEALLWLLKRKFDREKRGVEGENKV